jgi:hypothetical protein
MKRGRIGHFNYTVPQDYYAKIGESNDPSKSRILQARVFSQDAILRVMYKL